MSAAPDEPSDAALAVPAPPAPPPAAAEGSGRGLMIGMAAGYLLVGLLAASAAKYLTPAKPAASEAKEPTESEPAKPDPAKHDPKSDGHHSPDEHAAEAAHHAVAKEPTSPDEALRSGRFEDALHMLQSAGKKDALKEGVCLEALGRWSEAADAYQKAIDPDGDPGAWALANLGAARVAVAKHDHAAANTLISSVLLRSGHPACRAVRAAEEAVLLRARLTLQTLGTPPTPDPLDTSAVAWADLGGGVEHLPDWRAKAPAGSNRSAEPIRFTPNVAHPDRSPVTAGLAGVTPLDALRQLATAAGLRADIDPACSEKLSGKAVAIDTDGLPLADLVAALVEPHGLHGRVTKDAIQVTVGEHNPSRKEARDALRRAAAVAPTHPRAVAARLAASNLALADGRRAEAIDEYRKLIADHPHSPEAGPACRNLGLAHLDAGDPVAARTAFVQAVDRGTTDAEKAVGQWWVGRTHLDAGDPHAALRPLRAALNGTSKPASSAAVLGLTVAHLLVGDDEAADAVLRKNPPARGDRHAAQSAFLDSLIRFRANPTPTRGEALLQAATAADNGLPLGPAGVFVAGQAYRDCGFGGAMAELYDRTLSTVRGRLAVRMQYAAAVQMLADDKIPDARRRLAAVHAADPDGLGTAAGLKLAELAARDGRGAECVAACQELLHRPGVDRPAVLAVMGRGYELVGDFRQAAECFAGRPSADAKIGPDHEKAH